MNKALFLTNAKYIDSKSREGGVKYCTQEYIDLIKTKFDIIFFPVNLKKSFLYRIKNKLGLNAYNHYQEKKYQENLRQIINDNNIKVVFLNLTNTIIFSKLIKIIDPLTKIILCSHGNESGDFLHEIVLHRKSKGLRAMASYYSLGKMLSIESEYRTYVDIVITVSDIEVNIERWLGAKKTYLAYRTIKEDTIIFKPLPGRIGFFGDLSHAPNFHGIQTVCKALQKLDTAQMQLRLIGTDLINGKILETKYSFIKYLGYLDEDALRGEVSSWTFMLNPVFYYSRGVSTKLGKGLGWKLPAITTKIGMRGYKWEDGKILSCETPDEMALCIIQNAHNITSSNFYGNEIDKIRKSSPSLEDMMNDVCRILEI